jgi:hypothetical protein
MYTTRAQPVSGSPPPSSLTGSCGARAALWRALTQHGNKAFEQQHDTRARHLYEEALAEAEALFKAAEESVGSATLRLAPMAYNTSCQNVAELARRQRDVETVGIFLYRAYERLVSVAESAKPPLELRSACLEPLGAAAEALIGYLGAHGLRDAAFTYTERAKAATFQVLALTEEPPTREPAPA